MNNLQKITSMSRILPLPLLLSALFLSCHHQKDEGPLTAYVDPMIGTGFHGHTFPGAVRPYGMVQVSPDTRLNEWDNCSGYHYSNPTIMGFTHTHFSGTGGGGGSDILFMPDTGREKFEAGPENEPLKGYRSVYSHAHEDAEAGYYRVLLDDNHITVELTATPRCAFHRYTYPAGDDGWVILDLEHGNEDQPDSLFLDTTSLMTAARELSGYRAASGGLDGPKVWYFVARFSKPVKHLSVISADGSGHPPKRLKAILHFDVSDAQPLLLKVALSPVSIEGARRNLEQEIPGWDFGKVRSQARRAWEEELGKITIHGATRRQMRTFYTAMYHSFIHPSLYSDVDGRYLSSNGRMYHAADFTNYTNFSLWDTWRALHPLQTIINRRRTLDFIRTFLERYEHSGNMPIMEFSGNERYAMIGYHSLPVVADAWAKGIRGYDCDEALRAMIHLANSPRAGKKYYLSYGFIPYDLAAQSVSRTLEYAYDDWCITRLAEDHDSAAFSLFNQRGQFYRNLFKEDVKFMVPRSSEYTWLEDFNPGESSSNYTEANAWQYTPSVFQDIYGLIGLMGGDSAFVDWLDRLFTTPVDTQVMKVIDASGQIGQYAHGNEPSHHIAYLYDYAGAPWKTQARVRQILTELYDDTPAGISGNDDAGQMSAWYVLSSLGLYAVTPGLDYFTLGVPLFDRAEIHLENGKTFVIRAEHNAPDHPYVQEVTLNGRPWPYVYLPADKILEGGELVFTLGPRPDKSRGTAPAYRPPLPHYEAIPLPVITFPSRIFLDRTQVRLSCPAPGAVIRYTLDGREPDERSPRYTSPLTITRSLTLRARCYLPGRGGGYAVAQTFRKATLTPPTTLRQPRPGLRYTYREGLISSTAELDKYPVRNRGIIATFNVDSIRDQRPFSYRFTGYLQAPLDGLYRFYLESNDGAVLYLDGEKIIDNDGGHPAQALLTSVGLKKGYHTIRVDYFQLGRAKKLVVKWQPPGRNEMEEIPARALWH